MGKWMSRFTTIVIVGILSASYLSAQNQHSNQGRGFDANGVYSSKAIDNINLFNGSLTLSIPIGGTYRVGNSLSYSFTLTYNSQLWSQREICPVNASTDLFYVWTRAVYRSGFGWIVLSEPLIGDSEDPTPRARNSGGCFTVSHPNPSDNAGLGWQFSFGKLYAPRYNTEDNNSMATERGLWVYQSPDGSEHAFYDELHETDPAGSPDYSYTRDGSYLRLRKVSSVVQEVEFPDGTVHQFSRADLGSKERWRLVQMRDQFGGWVNITYTNEYEWLIEDSIGRTHHIYFADEATPINLFKYQPVVKTISLEAFGGSTATYNFNYQATTIQRGSPHVPDWDQEPSEISLPFLTSVTLPDDSSFKMPLGSYDLTGDQSSPKMRGVITDIELPTGATINWEYKGPTTETVNGVTRKLWYGYPKVSSARAYGRASIGVRKRTVRENGSTYVWKYDPMPEPGPDLNERPECIQGEFRPDCSPKEFINRVTDPLGNYTKNYYSVYPHPFITTLGRTLSDWHVAEYGLPLSKGRKVTDSKGNPIFLSTQYFKAGDTMESNPVRSVYVRYETDAIPENDGFGSPKETNRRLVATRTHYLDDKANGLRYSEVQYSNFDGLGHYRRVETLGNFSTQDGLTEETNYNPGRGRYEVDPASNSPSDRHTYTRFPEDPATPWVLGTYTEKVNWEGTGNNLTGASKKEFYFNSKGQLMRQRNLKESGGNGTQPEQSVNDVLIVFEYNGDGTLSNEKGYGGDKQTIGKGALSSLPVANYVNDYWVTHTYDGHRFLTSSRYRAVNGNELNTIPYIVNQVPDASTGLVSTVYETSGATETGFYTNYTYDGMGRLTGISPQAGSKTVIEYTPYSNAGLATAVVYHKNNAGSTTLAEERYEYDHMGRLRTETRKLADGTYISRRTKYNGLGWKESESMWGSDNLDSKLTEYKQFDMFGRPTLIRPPDSTAGNSFGHDVTLKYRGIRQIERTVNIGATWNNGNVDETASTTTEYYDVHGRLRGVTEPSGTGGAGVFTGYEYDSNSRLVQVRSNGLEPSLEPTTAPPTPRNPGVNVALAANNATVAVSSSYDLSRFPPGTIIDGDRMGRGWSAGTGGWNDGTSGTWPDWVEVRFNGNKVIDEVDVYTLRDDFQTNATEPSLDEIFTQYGITDFDLQYWNGSQWVWLDSVYGSNNVWTQFKFAPIKTSKIRLTVNGSIKNFSRIVEVEAYESRNVALASAGATVWASSSLDENKWPKLSAIDGDRTGAGWGQGTGGWNDGTPSNFTDDRLEVTFSGGTKKTISEINVFTLQDNSQYPVDPNIKQTFTLFGITDFDVQYLKDDGTWQAVPGGSVNGNNRVWRQFTFPPISTSKVRVKVRNAISPYDNKYSRIVEIEAYTPAPSGTATATASVESATAAATTITQTRTFVYDNRGFLKSESLPELGAAGANGTITYGSYDARGNVGTRSDGVNQLRYTYDRAGRLTQIEGFIDDEPDDSTPDSDPPVWRSLKNFAYYPRNDTSAYGSGYSFGKVQTATRHNWLTNPYTGNFTDMAVTETFLYAGQQGRVSRRTTAFSSGSSFQQDFTYNDLGDLASQSYPISSEVPALAVISYTYANGALTKIKGIDATYADQISYHPNGMLASFVHNNGVKDVFGQDPNRMQRVASISTELANTNWQSGAYSYDGAGNVKKIGSDHYLYDGAGRVIEGTTVNGTWKQQYEYDSFGNTTKFTTTRPGTPTNVNAFGADSSKNRLSGVLYDTAGNVLGLTSQIYRYDAFNMMKAAPDRVFVYNADDERVYINKNPGTNKSMYLDVFILRGLNDEVLREVQIGPNLTQPPGPDGNYPRIWTWLKDYIYLDQKLIATESPDEGRLEYHSDHLGTPRMITVATKYLASQNYFFPFGEQAFPQPENWYQQNQRLKFTGHERDINQPPGHQLDYMHARYYSMFHGKFINIDPGRDNDPKRPQSWNLYSYVQNNPVGSTDPDGRAGQSTCAPLVLPIDPVQSVLAATPADIRKNAMTKYSVQLILTTAKEYGLSPEQTAYVLATAQHESRMGNVMTELWGPTAAQLKYPEGKHFRGRGLVQITHGRNYWRAGAVTGLGADLWLQPGKATDLRVSVKVTIDGMINGTFRSDLSGNPYTLDRFISGRSRNYYEARSIINGDRNINGRAIARQAEAYYRALTISGW